MLVTKKKQQNFVKAITCTKSDYPRTPKVTPKYHRTHLISYIIHFFIHSDENKAKTASNSFNFKFIASKKVLLNTTETP